MFTVVSYENCHPNRMLIQVNPVHVLAFCFFKIYLNSVLLSKPVSPEGSLPFRVSDEMSPVSHSCYTLPHLTPIMYLLHILIILLYQ